jgi:type II secretory pathway pseudopilin PulG
VLIIAGLLATLAVTSAPADEYFGKLKMSALRVRYETMQLKTRYETHRLLPEQTEHLLLLTQDSFDQWAARYPKDPWLASTGFLIAVLYAELPGANAREHAVTLYVFVKSHFPRSSYATSSRSALHHGVTTKADPAWAKEMRATAPSASPAASPSASPAAAPSASPGGSASAAPAAAPSASPSAPPREYERPR